VRLLASRPTPQPGGPVYPSSSGSYPWVALPVATLPPAQLSGSREHSYPTTTKQIPYTLKSYAMRTYGGEDQ
jgi:hypothetical protein